MNASTLQDRSRREFGQGIVIAADVNTLDELSALTEVAADFSDVVALKLGALLAIRFGLHQAVSAVRRISDLPVIYDHQKAGTDIPQMGRPFARACRDAGVQAVIFFPMAGPKTLEAFVRGAQDEDLVPIVGLVMTHQMYLLREGGYIADDAPEAICSTALRLDVSHFVLPGTKPEVVREFATGTLSRIRCRIFMPGIGSQGGSLVTAIEAARPHVALPIVGSAVYSATDPRRALAQFSAELSR